MLRDSLGNVGRLFGKGPRYERGLSFLLRGDLRALPAGRTEIDGDDAFALVLDYETHPFNPDGWEAHGKYLDVQMLVSGSESYAVAPVESMRVRTPYDAARDVMLLSGQGEPVPFPKGSFIIFEPSDAHQPGIAAGTPEKVRKVVVKIRI